MARRLSAPRTVGTIRFDGPFFARDPGKTFRQNVRVLMAAVAREGESSARARIASIPPRGIQTGRTRAKIRGRVTANAGRKWASTAVIGIPNVGMSRREAIATYAAISEIERQYHPMRDTAKDLRAARDVNVSELLRGIE